MELIDDQHGELLRNVLIHFKSIEERVKWSKSINKCTSKDKNLMNNALNKLRAGINDLYFIIDNKELVTKLKKEIEGPDLAYYMTLSEQLFNLPEEDLLDVTDLIDSYLKKKYDTK